MSKPKLKSTTSERTKTSRTKSSSAVVRREGKIGRFVTLERRARGKNISYKVPAKVFKELDKYRVDETEDSGSIDSDSFLKDLSASCKVQLSQAAMNLKGLRVREDITQDVFAKKVEIAQSNLSAMEAGKRPVGKELAKRIGKKFNVDYRLLL